MLNLHKHFGGYNQFAKEKGKLQWLKYEQYVKISKLGSDVGLLLTIRIF